MDQIANRDGWSRRQFLGLGGALVVSFALPGPARAVARGGDGTWPKTLDPEALDSWLAITEDGRVLAGVGKIDAGMGIGTSFAQIIADELDVDFERVTMLMGDTATTVDQRGTGSSNGIAKAGPTMHAAGAEARLALLTMAATRLGAPAERLTVDNGVVSVVGAPQRRVSYAELVGGKRFELKMSGNAEPKSPDRYRYVGKPVPRADIAPKVSAQYRYLVDLRLPDMVHGRVIRPPQAGARLLGVEPEQDFPGLLRIVTRGDFVAVVCEREEQAVAAARDLKLRWSEPEPMFAASYDALYESLRDAKPIATEEDDTHGDVEATLASAPMKLQAQYDYPFQSHASMGPGCAVARIGAAGVEVWAGGQKPYPLRKAVAKLLDRPIEQVRVSWMPGPGSYGMNDADDAAIDAVLLAQAAGRPVRVQYMRHDATAWDPKGPPSTIRMRGGLDAEGRLLAFDFEACGYSGQLRRSGTDLPGEALSCRLIGGMEGSSEHEFQLSEDGYQVANKRKRSHLVDWQRSLITGLRTAHLRDPDGPSTCFASESFVDELAAAAGIDPVEFRLAYLQDPRHIGVIRAAADKAGWERRPSPRPGQSGQSGQSGQTRRGRGIAYAPRSGTLVAIVAEISVDMDSGDLHVDRFVVAHDCGFVINPSSLTGTIEANLMMGLSRSKYEAVAFDEHSVSSVDWATYPIAEMADAPDQVEIVLLNNMPGKSYGAGEPASRPVAAALANALFDATGVRIRRVPFSPQALQAAFRADAANI